MELFGYLQDGRAVERYILHNDAGMTAKVLTFGGIISELRVPDGTGSARNVALGLRSLAEYEAGHPYFGAITGRYANRIAAGRFTLDGRRYQLYKNDGRNSLHGGQTGFDKRLWSARAAGKALELCYSSPAGEEGYPGQLDVTVRYSLGEDCALCIAYQAETDAPTVLNLTNHSYINLAGEGAGSIEQHLLQIYADAYTPTDESQIPTGEIAPVAGTPFDFREPKPIGSDLRAAHEQIIRGQGYDHNFVLNRPSSAPGNLALAARVSCPSTQLHMEVWTTEPGLQFYSGNMLDGTLTGLSGRRYRAGDGFALETQHFPDSPNQPHFPSVLLLPGQQFRSTTIYRFKAGSA